MKVIIDRFEGNVAVIELEDKSFCNVPKILLPDTAKEGDVISIIIDEDETLKRKQEVQKLFDALLTGDES